MTPFTSSSGGDSDPNSLQLKILLGIIRPVCRFAIKHSLRIQEIVEVCKKALVEVAVEEIERAGDQVSVSRINVMTGIHRAQVDQILKGEASGKANHVVSRVIERWQSDKRFSTASGAPSVLPLDGMSSPFVKLIQSVSTDLNPYTVLFELERTGFVTRTKTGVKLQKRIYLTRDKMEGYRFLAEDSEDLLLAVQENLEEELTEPNLHVKTEYNNIPRRHLSKVREWMLREGSAFHRKVRTFLSKLDADDTNGEGGERYRVALGSFSITTRIGDKEGR